MSERTETGASFSRRTALGLAAGAGAIALLGFDPFAPAANASVTWNHPFTTRRTIPTDGEYLNNAPFRGGNPHSGVDLNGTLGMSVYNCAPGTVTWAGLGSTNWGYWVEIQHSDGTRTAYAHLQPGSITVTGGQILTTTLKIGNVGGSGTGGVTQYPAHLHLVRKSGAGSLMDPTFLAYADPAVPGSLPPTLGGLSVALAIARILRSGVGEHYLFVSPTRVSMSPELSMLSPGDRAFQDNVMRIIAQSAGYPAGYTPPLVDDSANGGWWLRDQIANRIAGMPSGYALSPTNPYQAP